MKQAHLTSSGIAFRKGEYGCEGRDIKYEGQVERALTDMPVTLMIGGEENCDKPFYPAETLAITLADLLQKGCHEITVCTYRSAALAFNGVSPDAYYSETEQKDRIFSCLLELDVDPDLLSKIKFVSSQEDMATQEILRGFLVYPEKTHPIVRPLEELYKNNEDFRKSVDNAILAGFRNNKNAYKYTLFELAMILTRKPAIKAGDIREKKYDDIVRKFREELGWSLSEGDSKNQKPFQVIYWNRDNTQARYHDYVTKKRIDHTESQLQQQSKKIQTLRRWCMGAVAAVVALPGMGYYLGKFKGLTDDRYAALQEMHGRDNQLYDYFQQALTGHWHNIGYRDVSFFEYVKESSPLLHNGISKKDNQGRPNVLFYETINKNVYHYQTQLTHEIVSPAKNFWMGRDSARFSVYEKMVSEIVGSYLSHERFDSYEQFSQTVCHSSLIIAAQKFLMAPLADPVRMKHAVHSSEFESGLDEWYGLQAQELRHDFELGRQYLIAHDMFIGQYYCGPDAYFPESRQTLMMLCESFYPPGLASRNYDTDTIKKIHALYHALLPILEKNQWKNFNYYGVAIDALKKSPEALQVLGLFGFSVDHFDLPATQSFISDWIIGVTGRIPTREPDAVSVQVDEKTQQWVRQHWENEKKSMRELGAYTPLEIAQKLEQRAQK